MTETAKAPDPMIGTVIDQYLITEQIRDGIGGTLYLAMHPALGKRAAIKLTRLDGSDVEHKAERFFAEGRAAAMIDHANVISVFNFGRLEDGRLYLLMEYLDGETLEAFLTRQGALDLATIRSVGGQILASLAACHERGIVHRDVKPDNLLLIPRPGGYKQVKLIDFGIAGSMDHELGPAITVPGSVLGTPLYMAPEQVNFEGKNTVDCRADLYAFGVMLYRMATGQLPFFDNDWRRVLYKHLNEKPVPPITVRPTIPQALNDLILRCLDKRPDKRPSTATALLSELLAVPEMNATPPEPIEEIVIPPLPPDEPPKGAPSLAWLLGSAMAGAVLGAVTMWLLH
jgi:serine/threonine protein kinase